MDNNINFGINFNMNGETAVNAFFVALQNNMDTLNMGLHQINQTLNETSDKTVKAIEGISKSTETTTRLTKINWLATFDLIEKGVSSLTQISTSGLALNQNLSELSAITGLTGNSLKEIETAARQTAKVFGTDAAANVESYKMMLSQLSPNIAKNSEAMRMMGENVNILSKQMGGDTVAATEVLNTSLNQFGVSMDDPIAATKVMADMMNTMSAAAQQGSAELPQIKQALEQVGMVAKTTGLSFAETNAYIQLLDQAGKKGSEGGIALRNVLTTLSEGRFTSKLATEGLQQAGISVDYLADTSIPLSERLKTLRKIQGDTALMTKVFGKENMAAAIAMINTADQAQAMADSIVGTNSAMEQAEIIMESSAEKNARLKAQVDDFRISIFNLGEGFFGYSGVIADVINQGTSLAPVFILLKTIVTSFTVATKRQALWNGILATKTAIVTGATKVWAVAQGILNAVMYANPIGLIIAAIVALVGYIATAINYFDSFGSTMMLLLGPIGMLISAFMMIKRHWDSIVEAFKSDGIIGALKRIGLVLLDVLMHPLQRILGWVAELTDWDWAKDATGSVEEFRERMNLITDDEKKEETKDDEKKEIATNPITGNHTDVFDVSKGNKIPQTPTVGGVAAKQATEKERKSGGGGSSSGKVLSLNVNTLIGNITIQTTNLKEGKQQIVEQVKEAMLTAVADFTAAS